MSPRPRKLARVCGVPRSNLFKPAGIPASSLETINLTREEFEALRLKDFKGLDQNDCAIQMNLSQPTFHRLLLSVRMKVGDALVNGKSISFEKDEE